MLRSVAISAQAPLKTCLRSCTFSLSPLSSKMQGSLSFFQKGAIDISDQEGNSADGSKTSEVKNTAPPPLRVITADGRGFAMVGSRVDSVEVHAFEDLKRCQRQEVKDCFQQATHMTLGCFQILGHPTDAAREIVRCPLCPCYSLSVQSKGMQAQWKQLMLTHLKHRHGLSVSPSGSSSKAKKVINTKKNLRLVGKGEGL